jgi:YD repeat-containing protein
VAGSGSTRTRYFYNLDRQPTRILRPDGQTIGLDYDSATGQLNTITTPSGQTFYTYNQPGCNCSGVGRPSTITAPGGVINYTYDGDLLTSTAWSGTVNGSVGRTYDNDFRLTTLTVNGQDPVSFGYDNDSLLTSAGSLILNRNQQNGLLTGTTVGMVSDSWTYSNFAEPATYSATIGGSPIFSVIYTRDKLGRIETKNETIQGVTDNYVYGYDPAGRLSDVTKNGALISHYEYDLNGNRNISTISGLTVTYTHDDQDRLLQAAGPSPQAPVEYTYTANGELRTKTVGTDTTTYDYDVQGNLMGVTLPNGTQVEYIVDALNRRIGKRVNGALVQGFLYQDVLKPIAELNEANQVPAFSPLGLPADCTTRTLRWCDSERVITTQRPADGQPKTRSALMLETPTSMGT